MTALRWTVEGSEVFLRARLLHHEKTETEPLALVHYPAEPGPADYTKATVQTETWDIGMYGPLPMARREVRPPDFPGPTSAFTVRVWQTETVKQTKQGDRFKSLALSAQLWSHERGWLWLFDKDGTESFVAALARVGSMMWPRWEVSYVRLDE